MNRQLFREKSMERISSPEKLDHYIRVPDTGTWMILLTVILLLIGTCIWGIFGHLDTKIETIAVAKDGNVTCYISETDLQNVKDGTSVFIGEKEYQIENVSEIPVELTEEQLLALGKESSGGKFYLATVNANLEDGIYKAEFITDSVSPASFVLN